MLVLVVFVVVVALINFWLGVFNSFIWLGYSC